MSDLNLELVGRETQVQVGQSLGGCGNCDLRPRRAWRSQNLKVSKGGVGEMDLMKVLCQVNELSSVALIDRLQFVL